MKKIALIVAGGKGNRMNSELPKQFIEIAGLPILMHTMLRFREFDEELELVLVLPEPQIEIWKDLCLKYHFEHQHRIVVGGEERFFSVQNGLDVLSEEGIVFIHDGVRPLVSLETIQRCYQKAVEKGNAIPVLPIIESIRKIKKKSNRSVNRKKYVGIQTPQVFNLKTIKAAYKLGYSSIFTDDASVLERTGASINLVEGNRENIKITEPFDLKLATVMLATEN